MADLAKETAERGADTVIVAASPNLLGLIRPHFSALKHAHLTVVDMAKDLTPMSAPELHDYLAREELVPPRVRLS